MLADWDTYVAPTGKPNRDTQDGCTNGPPVVPLVAAINNACCASKHQQHVSKLSRRAHAKMNARDPHITRTMGCIHSGLQSGSWFLVSISASYKGSTVWKRDTEKWHAFTSMEAFRPGMWIHTLSLVALFGDRFRGEPHSFPGAFLTARHTCEQHTGIVSEIKQLFLPVINNNSFQLAFGSGYYRSPVRCMLRGTLSRGAYTTDQVSATKSKDEAPATGRQGPSVSTPR